MLGHVRRASWWQRPSHASDKEQLMTACGQGARWLIVERGDQKEATWQQVPVQKPQTER